MKKSYLKYLIIILFIILFLNFVNDKLILRIDASTHLTRNWHLKESLKKGYFPTIYPYMALSIPDYKFYPPVSRIILGFSFLILDGLSELYIMKYLSLFMILFQALSFYFLAKVLFKDEVKAVLASILLLILPSNWLLLTIFGRIGATYATPFMFLFLGFYIKYLRKPDKKNMVLSTLMLSLSFLTHPFIYLQFIILAIIYSLFHLKKKGLKVFTPLIIGTGLCMFYFIPLFNLPSLFTLTFSVKMDKLALFIPPIEGYDNDKVIYLSPIIFFGGIAGAALILKKKLKKLNPLLIWYAYTLLFILTLELFTIITKRMGWLIYLPVFGIASCLIFPALITKKKNMNYLIYGLVGLFTVLNGIYIINYSGLDSPDSIKDDNIYQFIPEYSYDNNILTLPKMPNFEFIPFYSKINNAGMGISWGGINAKYLNLLLSLFYTELTQDAFYKLFKDLNVHIIAIEKTSCIDIKKGSYRNWLIRFINNVLVVFDELLEKYPDEFTVLYDDENRIILRTEWNNSFVTGGTYEVIRPESIRITPQNDTMLVKLNYLNNWQVSDGITKESDNGMMIIETNSTEPIMLEFLPTAYDYVGVILSLITLCCLLIMIIRQ